MARPTKLTRQLIARIVKFVRAGNFPETAARLCGVSSSTFYRWQAQANRELESGGIHRDLFEALDAAAAVAEAAAVATIRQAMLENPSWAKWYLERKHSSRWGAEAKASGRWQYPVSSVEPEAEKDPYPDAVPSPLKDSATPTPAFDFSTVDPKRGLRAIKQVIEERQRTAQGVTASPKLVEKTGTTTVGISVFGVKGYGVGPTPSW